MLYEYRCSECSLAYESLAFAPIGRHLPDNPCHCGGDLIRMVSLFNSTPVAPEPYFNHSVGQVVTSHADFEEKLRIGSEIQSESTGIPHSYTPVSPAEARAITQSQAPNTDRSDRELHPSNPKRRIFT